MSLFTSMVCGIFLCSNNPDINKIDSQIMLVAIQGYNYAKQHNIVKSPLMLIADYSHDSAQKRLWLNNMETQKILLNNYVTHGLNSGGNVTKYFSNKPKSKQSSLGFFITQNNYVPHYDIF